MSYQPIRWVNGVTPLSAQNLNHMEQGIKDNETLVNDAVTELSTISMVPSSNQISIPTPTRLISYTTPDNGYLYLYQEGGTGISYIKNDEYEILFPSGNFMSIMVPVRKNNVFLINTRDNAELINLKFLYAKKGV